MHGYGGWFRTSNIILSQEDETTSRDDTLFSQEDETVSRRLEICQDVEIEWRDPDVVCGDLGFIVYDDHEIVISRTRDHYLEIMISCSRDGNFVISTFYLNIFRSSRNRISRRDFVILQNVECSKSAIVYSNRDLVFLYKSLAAVSVLFGNVCYVNSLRS